MNKKLFKKALTAVLTAAMLFTSNGVASLNASAAEDEKIYVEGVYTNFQKATMATQTSRQINAYVEPSYASVQRLQYKSSAPEVANVATTGLITALSPGKATITVTALDGSSQKETIEITVLNDMTITNKNVDSDNEVIVLDKTLGNLYIDTSVGDADIYLGGVTVRNILALDSGEYSLYMYDTTAKEVRIDNIQGEIESFAVDDKESKAPNLIIGENARIDDINARISASIRQEDGSVIEGLRVIQAEDGRITVYLENYTGGLLLDSSLGDLEIVTTGCILTNVNVGGDENAGTVVLTDGGNSEIENLTLSGAGNVNLGIATGEVNIDKNAKGASFSSSKSIGTLRNTGSGSKISITGSVDNLEANGANGNINVSTGGFIGTANINGTGSSITGDGEVSEAYVYANNVTVDTPNTLLTVGDVTGTKAQGKDVEGNTTAITETPSSGGGPGVIPLPPEREIEVGDIILDNDFESGEHDLSNNAQGTVTITVVDSEDSEHGKVAKITNKQDTWAGASFNLGRYVKKRVTIRLKADIKAEAAGDLKASIKIFNETLNKNEYEQVAIEEDANANEWYTIEGTFDLANNISAALIYFESPGMSYYYLDNIEITVDRIGDPIPVTGISIDPDSLDPDGSITIDINEIKILTPIVTPDTADNKEVTWLSANPSIATVEAGAVKGIATGSTTITAKTVDGNYTAEVDVTVTDQVLEVIPASENFENMDIGTELSWLGYGGGDGDATVIEDPANPFNKLLEVKPTSYNRAPIINITLPDDKSLSDYSHIKFKALWKSGDVGWKDVKVEADTTLSGTFGNTSRQIASVYRGSGVTTTLEEMELELNGNMGSLEGAIQISIGISCKGPEDSENTVYYLDDIVLVEDTSTPVPINGVTLNHSTLTLAQGANEQLTATITPPEFTTSDVITWMSDNPAVATVDVTGRVTGVGPGEATITATTAINGASDVAFTAECNVTITADIEFKLNRSHVVLGTISSTVVLTPSTGSDITWTTSDSDVAIVSNGTVTAVADGTTTITATNNITSETSLCRVDVNTKAIFIEDFEDGLKDDLLVNDYANPVIENSEVYDGQHSLLVQPSGQYNGIQYVFTNSSESAKKYQVSSYVKSAQAGTVHAMLQKQSGSYDTYAQNSSVGSTWVELNTGTGSNAIEVPAGATITARFKTNDGSSFYIDNIIITDITPSASETITLTDSSSATYGVSFNGSPVTGLTIDEVSNVVAVSGSSITVSTYKVASVYLDETYIGKTVSVTAKVRRTGNAGNLAWQMNSGAISVAAQWGASVDEWFTITGSAEVTQAGELYMTTDGDALTVYYVADLVITATEP